MHAWTFLCSFAGYPKLSINLYNIGKNKKYNIIYILRGVGRRNLVLVEGTRRGPTKLGMEQNTGGTSPFPGKTRIKLSMEMPLVIYICISIFLINKYFLGGFILCSLYLMVWWILAFVKNMTRVKRVLEKKGMQLQQFSS